MDRISQTAVGQYTALLVERGVAAACRPDFLKWIRYYLDFCAKYAITGSVSERVRLFLAKLRDKNQTADQRRQAAYAVSLFLEMEDETAPFELRRCAASAEGNGICAATALSLGAGVAVP